MRDKRLSFQSRRALFALVLFIVCAISAAAQQPATYTNPVIAGDFPDPSVIRVGQDYWATTTSGTWEPEFLIHHSTDLVNWEITGAVFQRRPDWTRSDFWAPEISQDHGRYFVYYTARKKDGPLCVAVATASNPAGPYTDHGPLVCQKDGSIDPAPVTDENGERYLVWKEDGNSRNQPTPLWAQKLNSDGTKLTGEKRELIRNDVPWEGGVVEGAFILRRGDWFYLFYSGNACCGRKCNYALGVARSRKLLGQWEKNPANPILAENETWQCPGHGSIVTDTEGRDFLLYHAYRKSETAFFIGRESMLDQVKWNSNGWPNINDGKGPSGRAVAPLGHPERETNSVSDEFNASSLNPGWQWPQSDAPSIRLEPERGGRLVLAPSGKHAKDILAAVVTRPAISGDYIATTLVETVGMKQGAQAGLAAYGDEENALGIAVGGGKISVWQRQNKQHKIVSTADAANSPQVYLKMTASDGFRYRFAWSRNGTDWKDAGDEVDGGYIEAVRVALTVGGDEAAAGKFEWFHLATRLKR